jgi:hypothetical protein
VNFFKGAALLDPNGLFNAGLEAKKTRAIDFREGDKVDQASLREIIRAAVALNSKKSRGQTRIRLAVDERFRGIRRTMAMFSLTCFGPSCSARRRWRD